MRFLVSAPIFPILCTLAISGGALADNGPVSLPTEGRFAVEPHAGTALHLEGTFMGSANETQVIATQVGNQVFSTNLGFFVREQDFSDAFDRPYAVGVDVSYGLTPLTEIFGGVSYTHAEAQTFKALDVTFTGTVGGTVIVAGSEFLGEFRDYQEYAARIGIRRFFARERIVKPYVSASAAVRHVPQIDLKLFDENTGTQVDDIRFYDDSVAFSAGLRVGFRLDVTSYAAIGLETGVTYLTELREDDDHLTAFREFADANSDSDRFEVPFTVRALVRF